MHLILLGTAGCHLCEQAQELVQACLPNDSQLEIIDIAEHEHWQAQYAIRIPVLYHPDTQKELTWRFTQAEVLAFIHDVSSYS